MEQNSDAQCMLNGAKEYITIINSDIQLFKDGAQKYLDSIKDESIINEKKNTELYERLLNIATKYCVRKENTLDYSIRVSRSSLGLNIWLSFGQGLELIQRCDFYINFYGGRYQVTDATVTSIIDKTLLFNEFDTIEEVMSFLGKEFIKFSGCNSVEDCFIKIDKNNE